MTETVDYYNRNAASYVAATAGVDLSPLHHRFLDHMPAGGLILDAGCGSGRDSRAFLEQGYRVRAFDASSEVARLAATQIHQPVAVQRFEELDERAVYDGIWACASLLHLPAAEIPAALQRLWTALKPAGLLYLSLKHGEGERVDPHGRHFTDATEARLRDWLSALPGVFDIKIWQTPDQRPERSETWVNAIVRRKTATANRLVTGEPANRFLLQLCDAIARADEIELAVSFVMVTGLRLLLPDLQEHGAQVRVFRAAGTSFHLKAYLFARLDAHHQLRGTAFIGSSNISRQALTDGLEWNYRVEYPGDDGFLEARARFEEIFRDLRTVALTDDWIDAYERRRIPPPRGLAPIEPDKEPPPVPTPIQAEALAALDATRRDGYRRGLVVLATGLGKTWLDPSTPKTWVPVGSCWSPTARSPGATAASTRNSSRTSWPPSPASGTR